MLIPHLHFCGNCEKAIAVYEKAFYTKAESIVYNRDYAPEECLDDNRIAHAVKIGRASCRERVLILV